VMLASMMSSVTHISSEATARLDAVRLEREIFDLMGHDLSQTVISRRPLGTSAPLQFCVNPPQASGTAYLNATAVFWQSSISRVQSSGTYQGSVAIVGYFVQKISNKRAQLRRVVIDPTDSLYQIYSSPSAWLPDTTLAQFTAVSGGTSYNQVDRGWAGDGVIGLWVRCLDANGVVITKDGAQATQNYTFDSRQGYSSTVANSFRFSTFNALPAFVDIGLVCVAPKDVDRIDSLPTPVALSPLEMESEMEQYVTAFSTSNRRVKTVTSSIRRFHLYGDN